MGVHHIDVPLAKKLNRELLSRAVRPPVPLAPATAGAYH